MCNQLPTRDEPDFLESLNSVDNRLREEQRENRMTASPQCALDQRAPNWSVPTALIPLTVTQLKESMQLGRHFPVSLQKVTEELCTILDTPDIFFPCVK